MEGFCNSLTQTLPFMYIAWSVSKTPALSWPATNITRNCLVLQELAGDAVNFRDFQLYYSNSKLTLCTQDDHILIQTGTNVNLFCAKLWRKLLIAVVKCRCLRQLQNQGQWVLIAPLLKLPAFLCPQRASLPLHPRLSPNLSLQNAVEKVRGVANYIELTGQVRIWIFVIHSWWLSLR